MKSGLLMMVSLGVLLLLVAACRPNLQPRVDELEGQVSRLQAEKSGLAQQVSSLQGEKSALQRQLSSLQGDKSGLQQQVSRLQGDKSSLEQQVSGLRGEKSSLEQQVFSLLRDKSSLDKQVSSLQGEKAGLQGQVEGLTEQNQFLEEIAGPPPAFLDKFYPPNAPAPVYALEMMALVGAMEGMFVDLQEQDIPGVQANYQAFKAQYEKVAGMVPEWTDRFPMAPVEALGQALASGDPAKVGAAMGQLGQACESCHMPYQMKVQQKYHWPDFATAMITDPLTQQQMPWLDFKMARIGPPFMGIGNDLAQGQVDNARNNFQVFSASFAALRQGCTNCHATPRTYYVDESIQALIDQLGEELTADSPNPAAVGGLMQRIGQESCGKCHLVHFPAAKAKRQWAWFEEIFK